MTLIAAADGSALGNPGPAGWAWYIDDSTWASGGWPHGTNNMGELTAVLDLLQQTAHLDDDLLIYCDSTYVINAITKWMPGWKRKGWKKGDGKPVMNVEIMQALDIAMQGRRVKFEWVKGHAGHPLNEAADQRANAAACAFRDGAPVAAGPGISGAAPTPELPAAPADLFSFEDDSPSDADLVIDLERSLLTDEVRSDRAAVAALLHDDWQEIGRSGRRWSRADQLDAIGPLDEPTTLEVLTIQQPAANVIHLVWRASSDRGPALRSSLWVCEGNTWRQLFHQGTAEA